MIFSAKVSASGETTRIPIIGQQSRHPSANLLFPAHKPNPNGATRMPPSGSVLILEQNSVTVCALTFRLYNPQAHFAGGSTGPISTAVRTSSRPARRRRILRSEPALPHRLPDRVDHGSLRGAQLCRAPGFGDLQRPRSASGQRVATDRRAPESEARDVLRRILSAGSECEFAAEKACAVKCRERESRMRFAA